MKRLIFTIMLFGASFAAFPQHTYVDTTTGTTITTTPMTGDGDLLTNHWLQIML